MNIGHTNTVYETGSTCYWSVIAWSSWTANASTIVLWIPVCSPRIHAESLSEALAAQHARVLSLQRTEAKPADVQREHIAEQQLHHRQVTARQITGSSHLLLAKEKKLGRKETRRSSLLLPHSMLIH